MQKYIPLDETTYRWFFDEPATTEDDLQNIRPFAEEYGAGYWSDNICGEWHLQLRAPDSWVNSFTKTAYNWLADWTDNNMQGLAGFISTCIDLPEDEAIVFFWRQDAGLETTWGVFLRNWINFLCEDEAPILICLRTGAAARFDAFGSIYIGCKN